LQALRHISGFFFCRKAINWADADEVGLGQVLDVLLRQLQLCEFENRGLRGDVQNDAFAIKFRKKFESEVRTQFSFAG
jgi:hypothetical protein